jgi:two-component system nitrogen regulation response regulator GlnG
MKPARILVADDDAALRTVLTHALEGAGYQVECAESAEALYQLQSREQGDLVITDVMMPGQSGMELLPRLRRHWPELPVIVISAQNMLTTAIAADEKGAVGFLPKPFDVDDLLQAVDRALTAKPKKQKSVKSPELAAVAKALDKSFVLGRSRAMQDIYMTVARLRDSDLTVLITGESGTGKEVVARALHEYSRWKSGPFVAVNMAAIPRELIESELFGHEKGAFTGAVQRVSGRFEQATGGTLFLDEIGDMPMEAQTRLLRVLQEGEFSMVGGRRTIKTSLRIIAASHHDLAASVKAGRFREDLYYRLNVIPLRIPPLRERREDIAALVEHFLTSSGKEVTPEALALLQAHNWPGNIRELENTLRRLSVLSAKQTIEAQEISSIINKPAKNTLRGEGSFSQVVSSALDALFTGQNPAKPTAGRVYETVLGQLEKPLIEMALKQNDGNQLRAAEWLGINRNTLRKKMRELGIGGLRGGEGN